MNDVHDTFAHNASVLRSRFGPHRLAESRRRSSTCAVAVVLLAFLAACGQSPSVTLTLAPASTEVVRGAEVEVEVTVSRLGGASGDVVLSVTGLPTHVTASFSPDTLSGGTLTSTLTVTAAASATAGSYDLVVNGAGADLSTSADLTLEVVSLTVTGHVVTLLDGPVIGASVRGQSDTDITDETGAFTLTGLSVPYDLSVWNSADEWVHVFEGLTSGDVLLAPIGPDLEAPTNVAPLSGDLTGDSIPVPVNQRVMVCVSSDDGFVFGCDTVIATEDSYSIDVGWYGSASRDVTLYALQFERDATGYPVAYPGYASMALTLTDGVATVADLDLGDSLATTVIDVEVDTPVALNGTLGTARLAPDLTLPVMLANTPATSHAVTMPVIDGGGYAFYAHNGFNQFGWQEVTSGTEAAVTMANVPLLISPDDATIAVNHDTEFNATNPAGGPVTFQWWNLSGLTISVTTAATSHAIPALAPYGLVLPDGGDMNWAVHAHSGTSVDEATDGFRDFNTFIALGFGSGAPGLTGDGTYAISETRGFVTEFVTVR